MKLKIANILVLVFGIIGLGISGFEIYQVLFNKITESSITGIFFPVFIILLIFWFLPDKKKNNNG